MLGDSEVIVFSQTTDPERAKSFYGKVLGLKFQGEDPFALSFSMGHLMLRVQKTSHIPASFFTRFGWIVPNINATVHELSEKGVVFDKQRGVPQDELGIWTVPDGTKVAWFKDPDGNVLSLTQFPAASQG